MKKNYLKIVSAVLVLVLSMSSISFASTSEPKLSENNTVSSAAASATLIRQGGNFQIWKGVPSDWANLNWSEPAVKSAQIDVLTPAIVASATASLIKSKIVGIWSIIGLGMLSSDLTFIMGDVFFQNVSNKCTLVNGKKTAYARIYKSHAQPGSGSQQYSKVYVKYFTDSNYSISCGTTDTILMYSWATGSRVAE